MYAPTLADRISGSDPLRRRQAVGRALARLLGRLDVRGLDDFPDTGAVVLAVNHRAFLDGPLLFGIVERPISFLVKVEAFTPRMTPVLRGAGQIPVVRHRLDVAPLRLALRILHGGGIVGIFPEGARGDGLARTAKPGVGYFALRTGATVVPVACHDTDALARRRGIHRPPVRFIFGAPLDVGHVPDGERVNRRQVIAATEQIRVSLADLVSATSRPMWAEAEAVA
jgi:1-acyl-sn-glycerol-3-phosphate acyltransferase